MNLLIIVLVAASNLWAAQTPDVRYEPTPYQVVDEMLALAEVTPKDKLFDLGSGDGRLVIKAAKLGAQAVGYEIDSVLVRRARNKIKDENLEALAKIEDKDLFDVDLSKASVVTLFLQPELNVRLIPQIRSMKAGSRVVSYIHDMQGAKPEKVIESKFNGKKIYLWRVPFKTE